MTPEQAVQHILTLLNSKQTQAALREAENALKTAPEHVGLLHVYAFGLRQAGRIEDAVKGAQTALLYAPGHFEIHNMLGNMLKSLGRHVEAEQSFRHSIRVRSDYAPAHKNLITLLIETGQISAAIQAGEVFVSVTNGRDADAHEALGRALKAQKSWNKSLIAFRTARALSPEHVAARFGEAVALVESGQTTDAKAICETLLRDGETAPQILRLLARAEMESSDFDAAVPHLEQAIAAGSPEAVKDYANLLWMTGRADDAISLLKGAIEAAGERPAQAVMGLDEMLDMEKPELVVQAFAHLPPETQVRPDFLIRLASAKSDLGETEEAFSLSDQAFQATPDNRVITYEFIVSALMSGRYDLALTHARVWRNKEPLNQNWIALEADALRMTGRQDEFHALYDYERFVIPARLDIPREYSSLEAFHADFIEQVHGSSAFRTHPLGQSARQGIQTPRNLVYDDRSVVKAYIEALYAPVRAYIGKLGNGSGHPYTARNSGSFHIGGCWSIFLLAGGRHVSHVHPNGWVSSAYYMAVPPEAKEDQINRPGWIKFGEPPYKLPDPAPAEHWVCPEPGTLVLFPAYMWHGTMPISGKVPRVTAPLDVQPGVAP